MSTPNEEGLEAPSIRINRLRQSTRWNIFETTLLYRYATDTSSHVESRRAHAVGEILCRRSLVKVSVLWENTSHLETEARTVTRALGDPFGTHDPRGHLSLHYYRATPTVLLLKSQQCFKPVPEEMIVFQLVPNGPEQGDLTEEWC